MFVALGDSITYGEGATGPYFTYPNVLANILRTRRYRKGAFGDVLAAPGWTSQNLRAAVMENGSAPLRNAAFAIVWVGGDDIAFAGLTMASNPARRSPQTAMRLMKSTLSSYAIQLAGLIRFIQQAGVTKIYVCTQYNPFPNSPMAVAGIGELNATTSAVAAKTGAYLAPTASWFEGRQNILIAGYRSGKIEDALRGFAPIHPNNDGHRVIAEGLSNMIL